MSWAWYPTKAGAKLLGIKAKKHSCYDCADEADHTAVGCSNVTCNTRPHCWARKFALRQKPRCSKSPNGCVPNWTFGNTAYCRGIKCPHLRGCLDCYDFVPHEHPERWDRMPRHKRVALDWMSEIGCLSLEVLRLKFQMLFRVAEERDLVFLIQTRHVARVASCLPTEFDPKRIQIGTSFCGPEDLDNVRALAELPPSVMRFIAFEPFHIPDTAQALDDLYTALDEAKPNWAYFGVTTGSACNIATPYERSIIGCLSDYLENAGRSVIYKSSCGPELYKRNEGVTLP